MLATYNVLASAYVQRAWYRRTPALVLNPAWRVPALVQYVVQLGCDIICLQEVEPESFVALRTSLGEQGYDGRYARKQSQRPEGVAIFYQRAAFELVGSRVIVYADGRGGAPDSGYIALMVMLHSAAGCLGVITTHLTWDPPNTPRDEQISRRQALQLLGEYETCAPAARAWIIAGDFNATPESETIAMIEGAGLRYAHRGRAGAYTCNVNGTARMIDYLFHSSGLLAEPRMPTAIDDKTILPSAEEPSDHVALLSRFSWQD